MFDLTGRKALVTGATGGLGGAIARALHAQGATVALSGTRRAALDELAADLSERAHIVEANLADKDAVEALVPAAELQDFIIELRSQTQGLGSYTHRFDHLAEARHK